MNSSIKTAVPILFIVLLFSLFRCANKVPPTGGPSDTIPPSLIYSNPKLNATNVNTRVYEFRYNEKIKLQNLNRTLIITPRIDFNFETKQSKKGFFLIFDENFTPNTTYTFNFRDAIQDVTEGNPPEQTKFTFSTGDYIDSLSISGYAIGLLKKDTLKEATIGLYIAGDTTTILNGSPYYFTQTEKNGYYELTNIKNGNYTLYGFTDGNSNLKLETKSEAYAFKSDTLDLQTDRDSLNLYFVHHDIRNFSIQSTLPAGPNFDINFNKYIIQYQLFPVYDSIRLYHNRVKENKTIRIYNTFFNKDSTAVFVSALDSTQNIVEDTVWIKFQESKRKPEDFSFTIQPANGQTIGENYAGEMEFNKPVAWIDTDSIYFRLDTVVVSSITSRDQVLANHNLTKFQFNFKLDKPYIDSLSILLDSLRQQTLAMDTTAISSQQEDEEQVEAATVTERTPAATKKTVSQATAKPQVSSKGLHLYLGKSAFISVENDSFPATTISYSFMDHKMFGTISGKVNSDENFILQLLDEQFKVVKQLYNAKTFRFTNIRPGNYTLRLQIDLNKNGVWDYGNLLERIEPEPVEYYVSDEGTYTISVRANWDITDLIIDYP